MTHRQRMLAAIRGEPTDRIPYAPRLDLWYRAHRRAGTLPAPYRHASLMEIVKDLDWGYHAVVPDFRDLRGPEDDCDRALGFYNIHTFPYRTVLDGVQRTVKTEGDRTLVEYHTPAGSLRTSVAYTEAMREAGVSVTHVAEQAFKSSDDYKPLRWLFDHARVEPNYDGYVKFARTVGEQGLAVGFISLAASPVHLMQRELMPLDLFFYEMADHPDEMERLAQSIGGYWEKLLAVVAASPAELILLGANYDATVTPPPFFARHILPTLKSFARTLHARGKYLLTHTDGENTGLLAHYLAAEIDVADSICPSPMTKLGLKQVRDVFGGKITIMGGIPSVALLPQSMSEKTFDAFLDRFFEEIGAGDRLILGISDTTPPGADFGRLRKIAARAEQFGPVPRK